MITALAARTKRRAIIARRSSLSFWWSFNFSCPAPWRSGLRQEAKQDQEEQ
jgi:hypothetical protein